MWLVTSFGFFSVVQKPGDTDLTVRSRARVDLEGLKERFVPELGEIREGEGTDYPFRASVPHAAFAEGFARAMRDIRYPNFKNEVEAEQGPDRASIYGHVWSVLWDVQEDG